MPQPVVLLDEILHPMKPALALGPGRGFWLIRSLVGQHVESRRLPEVHDSREGTARREVE